MKIIRGREAGKPSEQRTETFTGDVWFDPVLSDEGMAVASVFFTPTARTDWHRHGVAQILIVQHGRGLLWSDEGHGAILEPGVMAHIPAGERHWHGGAPDSYLLHLAISVGTTEWLEKVSDDDYQEALDDLL